MKYIVLFLLVLSLLSCEKNRKHMVTGAEYVVNLDSASDSFPLPVDLRYVPLETNDISLISSIDKILCRNQAIYIFDKDSQKVLVFRKDGRFLKSIHHVGQGPGEYIYAADIDVDDSGNIYVLDISSQSVIKYSSDNDSRFDVYKLNRSALDLVVVNDTFLLSRVSKKGSFDINLALWHQGKFKVLQHNELPESKSLAYASLHYLFRSGRHINYYERFCPLVYQIVGDSLIHRIALYSDRWPSTGEIKSWSKKTLQEQNEVDYLKDISACYEIRNYIQMKVSALPPIHVLIHKPSGKYYVLGITNRLTIPLMGPVASTGDEFVSYYCPNSYSQKKILKDSLHITGEQRANIESWGEEDNPILVFYRF